MAKLNEGISQIKKGSALETMYNRLLTGMEQASHETLPDFTGSDYVDGYVVNEEKINLEIHEYENITRKNSAYLLANTIISSLSSEEGGGSGTGGFVSINGDSMAGLLKALYGFTAGDNGIKINGCNVISYDNDIIALNGDVICSGYIRLGDLEISKDGISYQGNEFYHSGNSNKEDVSWTMKDGTVAGNLSVKGTSTFQSGITALYGVDLGFDNTSVLVISAKRLAQLTGDLNIVTGGIKFDDNYIIHVKNNNVISFSASNKILNWGDDNTKQINLQTSIYDDDGEYEMISKFGSAYFPESFKAGHNLGNILIETYKKSSEDSGVIFRRYIRLKSEDGPGFYSDGDSVFVEAPFKYNKVADDDTVQISEIIKSSFGYVESLSLYAPLNRKSSSLMFSTDADFFVFDKPIEGKKSIGIADSKTRLLPNELFFDDSIYWLALDNGVKHYGNAYFVNDIGSVTFSSGFAGNGWGIIQNKLTGNTSATFDDLTIRKKMRIYELEVQKQSVTNGSWWVSDACSGDLVEEIS